MESDRTRIGYIRVHYRAGPPERSTVGSAGFDLRACLDNPLEIPPGRIVLVPTGLALAIPEGFEGQVRARSGLVLKHGIAVLNGPGTIDSDYRGPLGVILGNLGAAAAPPFLIFVIGKAYDWNAAFITCGAAFLLSGILCLAVDASVPIAPTDD